MSANKKDSGFLLAGIAPALSDILFLSDDYTYHKLLELLKLSPGDWYPVSSIEEFENILLRLPLKDQLPLNQSMKAGSSILDAISAFPRELREQSCMVTSAGNSNNSISQQSINTFTITATRLGIHHKTIITNGSNPVGLVLTSEHSPEKVLLTYKGVSHQLRISSEELDSEYLLIDAYELTEGQIAESIDSLIRSKKYKVVLSLGNVSILKGKLLLQLQEYVKSNMIHCLSGNKDEFDKICPQLRTYADIRNVDLFNHVPYILLTLGKKGLVGFFHNEMIFHKAYPSKKIISTSGAGDIALGVFVSGIIKKVHHDKIMKDCAYYASRILNRLTSMFEEGIEAEG